MINKKKKGLASIETVIGGLIFVVVFAIICDFIVVSHRYLSLTDTAKEMARIMSVQGGSLTDKPASYLANYYTIDELAAVFKKQMNSMGFKDGEYQLSVKYTKVYDDITKGTVEKNIEEPILGIKSDGTYGVIKQTEKIEYLSNFSVNVKALYDWPFMNAVFKSQRSILSLSMPGLSEWKYAFDNWTDEGA